MIDKDEIKDFTDACTNLTKTNLKYALAVVNALKFTGSACKQQPATSQAQVVQ